MPIPERRPSAGVRWSVAVAVASAFVALAGFGAIWLGESGSPGGDAPEVAVAASSNAAVPVMATTPAAPPPPTTPPAPVLRVDGPVPATGKGRFAYATTAGPVLGTAGTLRRFRVAVEAEAQEQPNEFAALVDQVLGDRRSWIAGRGVRFQRTAAANADFTIYLATPGTAGQLCLRGGVNIRVGGTPYTSCRVGAKVVINLARWRLSVPEYVAAKTPLINYRQYVLNHEVGHFLGHGHERCPQRGRPAPVMQKQTLGLDGCVANAWPYVGGKRHTGPPL